MYIDQGNYQWFVVSEYAETIVNLIIKESASIRYSFYFDMQMSYDISFDEISLHKNINLSWTPYIPKRLLNLLIF